MPSNEKTTFTVEELDAASSYKLTTSLIAPRPIGWIGTRSTEGTSNLAPYSFFNVVASYPPTFVVAPSTVARRDTLDNLAETRVFTVNVVSESTVQAMNASAGSFPADVSEFDACGLTEVDASTIDAPMVGEAIANFECTVTHLVELGSGMLVVGEASKIHVVDRVVEDNFRIDQNQLHLIGRHAGGMYSRTAESLFEMERPD